MLNAARNPSVLCDEVELMPMNTTPVVFCWAEISGYMAACFSELSRHPGLDANFIAFASGRNGSGAKFSDKIVSGINCRLLEQSERDDPGLVKGLVRDLRPAVVVLCGWFHPAYRALLSAPELRNAKFVMAMDTPWLGRRRQWFGRYVLRSFVNRMAMVWVTGERSWQYAKRLGIPEEKLRRGTYGIDYRRLSRCQIHRTSENRPWPRKFLFSGRYAPEKGVELLVKSYQQYRRRVKDPWELICCGAGPLSNHLKDAPGIIDLGFQQPEQLFEVLSNVGCFVLPSLYDPWPLAVVEAAASGLPIICSEACGSSVEVVRHLYNGWLTATGDANCLASALVSAHDSHEQLPLMASRSSQFAEAYSAENWAARLLEILQRISV
jgi:glycosyltransferase involved in cell wall biosynthesis